MFNNIVALVGSPNVGKSTIFNRLVGHRDAIVNNQPGVTRDRIYGKVTWLDHSFNLVDTGGIEWKNRPFQDEIRAQVFVAIEEADIIVFLVDSKLGITKNDELIAKLLHKTKKPIILAVNKTDNAMMLSDLSEFYSLGLGEPLPISGAHGIGIGDLLDKIIKQLPSEDTICDEDGITFSMIGRPNVGKSTLVNTLLGRERVIVSTMAGTTRDAVDTRFEHGGRRYVVIDTAGLHRRGAPIEDIEKYAATRTMLALERSEIVLFMIDASEGIVELDKHVVGYASDVSKAIVIIVNKWDIKSDLIGDKQDFEKLIRKEFQFLSYAPIIFISAKQKTNIDAIFDALLKVHEAYSSRIPTNVLNVVLSDAQMANPAPEFQGGRLKIYYGTETSVCPPNITLFVNNPKYAHFSYIRYIENQLRASFNLDGTPIKIDLRERI